MHHLPEGTHSLAPRPGALGRLTFQIGLPSRSSESEGWSAWQDSHLQPFRVERNASALGYTRWCPRSDSHRHSARFKCAVSALDYVGATNADLTCACLARLPFCALHSPLCTRRWCRVREFHPQPLRSERSASGNWANAAKWHSRQESHLQPGGSKPPALIV